jgi:hypothetical protein
MVQVEMSQCLNGEYTNHQSTEICQVSRNASGRGGGALPIRGILRLPAVLEKSPLVTGEFCDYNT